MKHKHEWQYARTITKMHVGSPPRYIERINVFVCECGAVKEVKEKK